MRISPIAAVLLVSLTVMSAQADEAALQSARQLLLTGKYAEAEDAFRALASDEA